MLLDLCHYITLERHNALIIIRVVNIKCHHIFLNTYNIIYLIFTHIQHMYQFTTPLNKIIY